MKKRIPNPLRMGALAALLAVVPGIVTCDHESPQALYIMDAMAMLPGDCTLRPGQTATAIRMNGTLDLMIANNYWLYPHMRNMLESINTLTGEGSTSPQAEVNYVSVSKAKVYVDLGEFTPVSKPIVKGLPTDNAANLALGYKYATEGVEWVVTTSMAPKTESVVAVQVIPPELGNLLDFKMQKLVDGSGGNVTDPAVWITVYVTVWGETLDGHVIQSNEYSFPIMLCWGCLVVPFCGETVKTVPCWIGQDDFIDALLCPFVSTHPGECSPKCY